MEWYIMNADGQNAMAQDVCCYLDGELEISDECEDILQEIDSVLENDDPIHHPVQRHFCCCSFIQRSLIPLLIHCEDKDIIRLSLKLISRLTQPVDCQEIGLVPTQVLSEINSHISQVQALFSEGIVLMQLTGRMMMIFKETGNNMLEAENVEMTNYILVILRNLLYEVDGTQTKRHIMIKEAMVHNGMYDIILTMLASKQQELWCVHLVQLISLIFKDEVISPVPVPGAEDSAPVPFSSETDCDSIEMITDSCEDSFSSSNTGNSVYSTYFSQCIEKFIKSFLLEGFGPLVQNMQSILLSADNTSLSDCYYMWTVGHFISYCKPKVVPLSVLREVLNRDVFGFLVYKAVESCEQIQVVAKNKLPIGQLVRKNYLVVKALQELLQTVKMYKSVNTHSEYITELLGDLVRMKDLRQMFLLLIRQYSPMYDDKYYLRDVIMTNHTLLVLLEEFTRDCGTDGGVDMLKHVTQFGTQHVMAQYAEVLSSFKENPDFANEAVFTMMHHVAGDCGQQDSLLQFPIIRSFLEIGDEHKQLPEEYLDLMDFVFNKMTHLAEENPEKCAEKVLAIKSSEGEEEVNLWSEEELNELFCLYNEYQNSADVVGELVRELGKLGFNKKKAQVVQQLCISGLVDDQVMGTLLEQEAILDFMQSSQFMVTSDDPEEVVSLCVKSVCEELGDSAIRWLQETLLDAIYAKLDAVKKQPPQSIPWCHLLLKKPIPLVAYSDDQAAALKNYHFQALLSSLTFHMDDGGYLFPRIPHYWTSADLLSKAKQLGPVDFEMLSFTEEEVNQPQRMTNTDLGNTNFEYKDKKTHVPESLWIMLVQKCNLQQNQPASGHDNAAHSRLTEIK